MPLAVVLASRRLPTNTENPLTRVPWHIIPAIFLLSLADSIALYTGFRRFVVGFDEQGLSLDGGAEWW